MKETNEILSDFRRHLLSGSWAKSTIRHYLYEIRFFLRHAGKEPESCTQEDIESYLADISLGVSREYQRSTRQRKLAVLRVFFGYLAKKKLIQENPCDGLPSVKVPRKEQLYLSEEQVQQIFSTLSSDTTLSGKKSLAMAAMLYYLGVRVSELANIDLNHFVDGNPPTITIYGKGGKVRILPFSHQRLQGCLLPWRSFRQSFKGSTPALFISLKTKKRLSVRTIQRRVRSLGTQAGLSVSLSPHMLRRSFATHLLNKGADLFTIASLMGHENIEVTRRYARTSPKKREEALLLLP